MNLQSMLEKMWIDYCALNPAAKRIHDLFVAKGETVINDHIALRTFNHPRLGIESLAQHFKKYGYVAKGEYTFVEKKLFARHYEHPDENQPKIFISELELEKCSKLIQNAVEEMMTGLADSQIADPLFAMIGRPWKMSFQKYEELAKESEYASWVAAYGFRPNHFTVSMNHLHKFTDIRDLNAFIKEHGFKLNASGGEVKGTTADYLEQSSTMASEIPVQFTDGTHQIPGCYYEFAKRYPLENGKLYQGFVAKSADKIFESTGRAK